MSDVGNPGAGRADVVVVGGGSAGSVLASRLSEDPPRSVLLLEAGTAYGLDGYPDDLRDAAHMPGNPEHDWGFTTRGGASSPQIIAPRGKALGGSSTVNATVAMRARPSDITDWHQHGGPHDEWAVVDSHGGVKGIEGLRVVDASIMPVVPSVALNPTTIMIAERIATMAYAGEPGPNHRGAQLAPTA